MDGDISVAVLTLDNLFSERYRYHLPWFQRAYAWREEHVGRLLADVLQAMAGEKRGYYLGRIRLAKHADRPQSSLVDGQQRAITLTILFALLRDLISDAAEKVRIDSVIKAAAGELASEGAYRLTPQPVIASFFECYVQQRGATLIDPPGNVMSLAESERYILTNRNKLRAMLQEIGDQPGVYVSIASFLLTRCRVIVDWVEDEDEAWSMLSTEEETGLGFHSSERVKLSLISVMPRHEQETASHVYESCQAMVGADSLCELLGHVRTLKLKRRSTKPVEKDLMQLFELNKSGKGFLESELLPRCRIMAQIKARDIGAGAAAASIARSLETLSWLNERYWVAAALQWAGQFGFEHREAPVFFQRLDRLAWMLRLAGTDPTEQERRFIRLIAETKEGAKVDRLEPLAISDRLRGLVLEGLRSRTFYAKHHCGLVLRRISLQLGSDPGPLTSAGVTVEHVLPRRPPKGGDWADAFPTDEDISNNINRLGNLVLLNFDDNQRAGTLDYRAKRQILARCGFVLSVRAAKDFSEWTPRSISNRTEALISALFEPWHIKS